MFDQLCDALGIKYRLTEPRTSQTNGIAERFNGRISGVLNTHRFVSGKYMQETLLRYTALYNHQSPQSALQSKTPMHAMKDWYKTYPPLLHKKPYFRPECDTWRVKESFYYLTFIHRINGRAFPSSGFINYALDSAFECSVRSQCFVSGIANKSNCVRLF